MRVSVARGHTTCAGPRRRSIYNNSLVRSYHAIRPVVWCHFVAHRTLCRQGASPSPAAHAPPHRFLGSLQWHVSVTVLKTSNLNDTL